MGHMRVCLYGLSANPPTGMEGHLGVVQYLASSGIFDEIWVLPVYRHMYQSKRQMVPFKHRLAMCQISFPGVSSPSCMVRVSELEKDVYEMQLANGTSDGSTIALLHHLKNKYTNKSHSWHLLLGSDTYNDLTSGKWKSGEEIITLVDTLEVALRQGCAMKPSSDATTQSKTNVHDIPTLNDVSSTSMREGIKLVRQGMEALGIEGSEGLHGRYSSTDKPEMDLSPFEGISHLHPKVAQYIMKHNLYSLPPKEPVPTPWPARLSGVALALAVVGPLIKSLCR